MSEPVQRHHVLEPFLARTEQRALTECGVAMEVLPYRGYLNLRGDLNDSGFTEAVREVLGRSLPGAANTFTEGGYRAFWLGPDEWLVMTDPGLEVALAQRLENALAGRTCALTDLTGGQICIRLRGRDARNALAKGCTLDLDPRVFAPGQCAQTVLGKASILIALSVAGPGLAVTGDTREGKDAGLADGAAVFDIIVRRPFAEYAAEWLYRSAEEYGIRLMGQSPGHASER